MIDGRQLQRKKTYKRKDWVGEGQREWEEHVHVSVQLKRLMREAEGLTVTCRASSPVSHVPTVHISCINPKQHTDHFVCTMPVLRLA